MIMLKNLAYIHVFTLVHAFRHGILVLRKYTIYLIPNLSPEMNLPTQNKYSLGFQDAVLYFEVNDL